MRAAAAVLLLGLAACAAPSATTASASVQMRGWATPSGKPPTQAEFAALLAACQDRATTAGATVPIDGCLGDLGLRRAP